MILKVSRLSAAKFGYQIGYDATSTFVALELGFKLLFEVTHDFTNHGWEE